MVFSEYPVMLRVAEGHNLVNNLDEALEKIHEEIPGKGLCCSQKYEVCAPGVSVELDNPILQKIPYTGGIKLWYDALSQNKHYGDLTKNIPRDLAEIICQAGPGHTL